MNQANGRVTGTPLLRFLWRIGHLDSHVRQIIALIAAVIAFVLSSRYGHAPVTHFIAIWDIYAIILIVMAWVTIGPLTLERFNGKPDCRIQAER